ncbi:Stress-70 protein [Binucleata daphniae]
MLFLQILSVLCRQAQKEDNDVLTEKQEGVPTNNGIAIGIDLGTTFSCIYAYDPNSNSNIHLKVENKPTYPSVLSFTKDTYQGETVYHPVTGYEAIKNNNNDPNSHNFFYAWKRLMGLSAKDMQTKELKDIHKKVTYEIDIESKGAGSIVSMIHKDKDGKVIQKIRPVDASKYILQALYEAAKKYNQVISSVVVTVPAYFTENQVKATSNAVEFAGIKLTRTMNEPVAAAYAYQMKEGSRKDHKYIVFDLGGGTLDISVTEYEDEVLEVKTYSGDNFLGGENMNDCLFNYFMREIETKKGKAMTRETDKLRLRNFVESFKITICEMMNVDSDKYYKNVSHAAEFFITEDDFIEFEMSTAKFNEVCAPVYKRVKHYIDDEEEGVIHKYKKLGGSIKEISKVLFVGGSSRIPHIRKIVGDIFGYEKLYYGLNADTVVAEGAAWYSASLAGYLDEKTSLHLVDVVSADIGICVSEDEFHSILDRDTTIPAKGTKIFTTAYDMQDRVSIQVAQGLRYSFKDNNHLGSFELKIKNPGPKGVPQIEVTVTMDKDRNVKVKAVDKATNEEEKVEFIRDDISLTPDELKQMKIDYENNKEKDNEIRERFEEVKRLESFVDGVKAKLASIKNEDVKKRIQGIIGGAESWMKTEKNNADKAMIKEKHDALKEDIEAILREEEGVKEEILMKEEKVREEL